MYRFTKTLGLLACVSLTAMSTARAQGAAAPELEIRSFSAGRAALALEGGAPFHSTRNQVLAPRVLAVPGGTGVVVTWDESSPAGELTPHYAISLTGTEFELVTATSYELKLRRMEFDPRTDAPTFNVSKLPSGGNVHIVQFVTQPLAGYRDALEGLGAKIHKYLPSHSYLVHMDASVRAQVAGLDFVRWVGPYHPEYRLEPYLLEKLGTPELKGDARYNILVFDKRAGQQDDVAKRIEGIGGHVDILDPGSAVLEATLSPEQMIQVVSWDEVTYLDRWGPMEDDMDIVRDFGGANIIENTLGYTGQGVRAEVADGNLLTTHADFGGTPIIHGPASGDASHGTPCFGINFGKGTTSAMARGMVPDAQGIFADTGFGWTGTSGDPGRYTHTQELVDPNDIYRGVYQSNSTGSPRTFDYTIVSTQMDEIVFDLDVIICQSQSNAGNQDSRPQAWGKNMVSVGGVNHEDTLGPGDDNWSFGGSIGPAADGRIKPDLAHFYDNIFTTSSSGAHTCCFGGTSGATPIVAGHFGVFFQMWHNGLWGNTPGTDVFDSRPHFSTAKAMMINHATQWAFFGTAHDLTRMHQGWGRPGLKNLKDLADKTFYVDETDLLTPLATNTYAFNVHGTIPQGLTGLPATGAPFKVTLVYPDIPGTTSATVHRINDISLRVTSPLGVEYWGNNGLSANMWSPSGGSENHIDTVENVFVQSPEQGIWKVDVIGTDITQDGHVETGAVDADYALVVNQVEDTCPPPLVYCFPKQTSIGTFPQIGFTGTPSLALNDFVVTLSNAPANKNGIVFWGLEPNNAPFKGGTLCVKQPIKRTPVQQTSASGTASYSETITTGMVGTNRYYEWWFRDPPASFTVGLSNALAVTFCD